MVEYNTNIINNISAISQPEIYLSTKVGGCFSILSDIAIHYRRVMQKLSISKIHLGTISAEGEALSSDKSATTLSSMRKIITTDQKKRNDGFWHMYIQGYKNRYYLDGYVKMFRAHTPYIFYTYSVLYKHYLSFYYLCKLGRTFRQLKYSKCTNIGTDVSAPADKCTGIYGKKKFRKVEPRSPLKSIRFRVYFFNKRPTVSALLRSKLFTSRSYAAFQTSVRRNLLCFFYGARDTFYIDGLSQRQLFKFENVGPSHE